MGRISEKPLALVLPENEVERAEKGGRPLEFTSDSRTIPVFHTSKIK
jgi:hypothetical protein